jgi:hypothetical protein
MDGVLLGCWFCTELDIVDLKFKTRERPQSGPRPTCTLLFLKINIEDVLFHSMQKYIW